MGTVNVLCWMEVTVRKVAPGQPMYKISGGYGHHCLPGKISLFSGFFKAGISGLRQRNTHLV